MLSSQDRFVVGVANGISSPRVTGEIGETCDFRKQIKPSLQSPNFRTMHAFSPRSPLESRAHELLDRLGKHAVFGSGLSHPCSHQTSERCTLSHQDRLWDLEEVEKHAVFGRRLSHSCSHQSSGRCALSSQDRLWNLEPMSYHGEIEETCDFCKHESLE